MMLSWNFLVYPLKYNKSKPYISITQMIMGANCWAVLRAVRLDAVVTAGVFAQCLEGRWETCMPCIFQSSPTVFFPFKARVLDFAGWLVLMKICLGPGPCGLSLSCRASLFTICLSSTRLESIQPTDRRGERKMGPRSTANNGNTASCFPWEGLRGGIRMNLVSNNWLSKLGKEYIKTVYCHPTY